jgi:hypothetical protein
MTRDDDAAAPGVPLEDLIEELGFSPSDFEGAARTRQVWVLWDCHDLVSIYSNEASANAARDARVAAARVELSPKYAYLAARTIQVSSHDLQD